MVQVGRREFVVQPKVPLDRFGRCQKPTALALPFLVLVIPAPGWPGHVHPTNDASKERANLAERHVVLPDSSIGVLYLDTPVLVVERPVKDGGVPVFGVVPECLGKRDELVADTLLHPDPRQLPRRFLGLSGVLVDDEPVDIVIIELVASVIRLDAMPFGLDVQDRVFVLDPNGIGA